MLGPAQGIPNPRAWHLTRGSLLVCGVPVDPTAPPAHGNATHPEKPHLQQRCPAAGQGELRFPPASTSAPQCQCRHRGAATALPAAAPHQGLSRHTAPSLLLPPKKGESALRVIPTATGRQEKGARHRVNKCRLIVFWAVWKHQISWVLAQQLICYKRFLWKKTVFWNTLQHSSLESISHSVMERSFKLTYGSDTNQQKHTVKSEIYSTFPKQMKHNSSHLGNQQGNALSSTSAFLPYTYANTKIRCSI